MDDATIAPQTDKAPSPPVVAPPDPPHPPAILPPSRAVILVRLVLVLLVTAISAAACALFAESDNRLPWPLTRLTGLTWIGLLIYSWFNLFRGLRDRYRPQKHSAVRWRSLLWTHFAATTLSFQLLIFLLLWAVVYPLFIDIYGRDAFSTLTVVGVIIMHGFNVLLAVAAIFASSDAMPVSTIPTVVATGLLYVFWGWVQYAAFGHYPYDEYTWRYDRQTGLIKKGWRCMVFCRIRMDVRDFGGQSVGYLLLLIVGAVGCAGITIGVHTLRDVWVRRRRRSSNVETTIVS